MGKSGGCMEKFLLAGNEQPGNEAGSESHGGWEPLECGAEGSNGPVFTGNRVPWGSSTDWELLQILQNPSWWSRITFWENGINVPNPFQYRRSQRLLEASFHFDRREQRCCGRSRDKAQAVHREEIADQPAGLRVSHSTE
jgi:hypothetical protein